MNLPVAAVGIAITALAAPESTDPAPAAGSTAPAWLALGVGLTAVVLALVQIRCLERVRRRLPLVAGRRLARAATPSGRIEHRVREPIVDFELFRNGPYFGASAAAFALVGAYWAVMFFQPQYLQDVRGPLADRSAGLMILPITAPMIFVSPFSGRLISRFGARRLMTAGMACGVAGLLLLAPDSPLTVPSGSSSAAISSSGSPSAWSTRRCRRRRWRRCRGRRSGSPPACWRWTGCWPAPFSLAATGAVFHALQGGGDSFADCDRRLHLVRGGAFALGAGLTWTFVRDPGEARTDPAVAGGSRRRAHCAIIGHHRRFHL